MDFYALCVAPFSDFSFMRRALVGCIALSFGCAPLGVFLVLRRMSLIGDAMAHAILPGAAVGFLIAGLSLFAMTLGGLIAGLAVAFIAGVVARLTPQREDASFAAFYLISLAAGVLIVSTKGSNVDLMHVLFGTVLAINNAALILIVSVTSVTLLLLALIYRALIVECFDPGFMHAVGGRGSLFHLLFLGAVVLNLVGGFHALGTLMVVGIMMLPAAASRFWAQEVWSSIAVAVLIAAGASATGLLLSFHIDLPSGPSVILTAGMLYCISVLFGPRDGIITRFVQLPHFQN